MQKSLIVAMIALGLVACGDNKPATTSAPATPPAASTPATTKAAESADAAKECQGALGALVCVQTGLWANTELAAKRRLIGMWPTRGFLLRTRDHSCEDGPGIVFIPSVIPWVLRCFQSSSRTRACMEPRLRVFGKAFRSEPSRRARTARG